MPAFAEAVSSHRRPALSDPVWSPARETVQLRAHLQSRRNMVCAARSARYVPRSPDSHVRNIPERKTENTAPSKKGSEMYCRFCSVKRIAHTMQRNQMQIQVLPEPFSPLSEVQPASAPVLPSAVWQKALSGTTALYPSGTKALFLLSESFAGKSQLPMHVSIRKQPQTRK